MNENTGYLRTVPELKRGEKGRYEAFLGEAWIENIHYSLFAVIQGEGLNREYSLKFSRLD